MSSIVKAILDPPYSVHEQCQTQEEKEEDCEIHLPAAKFDIMVCHPPSTEGVDHEIALVVNGNKTDATI